MLYRRGIPGRVLLTLVLASSFVILAAPLAAAPQAQPQSPDARQSAFTAAAREFGVPDSVLLAVSYNVSRWDDYRGAPSTSGGYGPMHLTQVNSIPVDGKGDDVARASRPAPNDPSLRTLDTAATLLGLSPDVLKRDPAQNIRGGAALLAQYAKDTIGAPSANEADWYGAVAKYSGSQESAIALDFADVVYTTIQQGAARKTNDGQNVRLPAKNVQPNKGTTGKLPLRNNRQSGVECPNGLKCASVPAAYQLNNPDDPTDYGNYDLANREADGLDIRYIVIHDTEVDYNTTLNIFQNPLNYASAQYVVRASDGFVAQMVQNKNVAWQAGNWYVNAHSIGIEHEGVAIEGATWYSEQMYRASARLTRYLAEKYNIPLDRAHIVGHDNVPGPTPGTQAGMHWDPGPFWDWDRYMQLLGAPINPNQRDRDSNIATIDPNFKTNQPVMTYCYDAEVNDCRLVPQQPSNFVYLYTAPRFDAPLITNPYIGSDPTRANNWANKAVTGEQFVVAERQGDWLAIWFSGQKAWLYNPRNYANVVPSRGMVIKPKAGRATIPVYGRAYPEASAYPADVPPQSVVPIYDMPADQKYVAFGPYKSDYYYAPTYNDPESYKVVRGQTEYYQIFYNHRFAFVQAADVDVVSGR